MTQLSSEFSRTQHHCSAFFHLATIVTFLKDTENFGYVILEAHICITVYSSAIGEVLVGCCYNTYKSLQYTDNECHLRMLLDIVIVVENSFGENYRNAHPHALV